MPTAVYPGSLDPITFGHIGAIHDTAAGFGKAIVAIGINPNKNYMFSLAEREALARKALGHIPGVSVTSFSGLLSHFLVRNDLKTVVRGIRNGQDLDDAMLQDTVGWQQSMGENINVFYVPARPGQNFISSTALKAIIKDQGNALPMAPMSTIHATQARMMGQYYYGVTGASGAGKSSVCRAFAEIAERRHIPLMHVDMDKLAHGILKDEADPIYVRTRQRILSAFGPSIQAEDGSIDRKKLGEIVFADPTKLTALNSIMHEPVFFHMNERLRGCKGIFLVDAALLAETQRSNIANNNMMLVTASKEDIAARLNNRDGLNSEQLSRRISSQFSGSAKKDALKAAISADRYGHLLQYHNSTGGSPEAAEQAFDQMLEQIDIYGELRIKGFLTGLGVKSPNTAYIDLLKCYSGNERLYHAMSHIVDGLNQIPALLPQLQNPQAFTLGWLFHDAIYNSRAKDNEEQSAALLGTLCKSWGITDKKLIQKAQRFVMVSKHGTVAAKTPDELLFVDLDFSIFGRPTPVFRAAESNIRREYDWASSTQWAAGRGAFLESIKPPVFKTNYFEDLYGAQALENIKTSLKRLKSGEPTP